MYDQFIILLKIVIIVADLLASHVCIEGASISIASEIDDASIISLAKTPFASQIDSVDGVLQVLNLLYYVIISLLFLYSPQTGYGFRKYGSLQYKVTGR